MNVFALFFNFVGWLVTFLFARATDFAVLTQEELRRLRNALVMAMVFPILLVAVGATVGAWSTSAKGWIILLGVPILLAQLFVLAWRRAIVGVAIGAVFEWGYRQATGFRAIIFRGLADYVNVLMWLVYTEVAVALVAIVLPVHENPIAALVVFLALIGLAAHAVQTGREFTWPRHARRILIVALAAAVVAILFPSLVGLPAGLRNLINRFLTWVGAGVGGWLAGSGPEKIGAWLVTNVAGLAGRAADNPLLLLLAVGLGLAAIVLLVLIIRGRWLQALVLGLILLLAIPVMSWVGGRAGWATPALPAGVTKHEFTLRPGERVSLSGIVIPRVHCWYSIEQWPPGARVWFDDGGPRDIATSRDWRGHPIALEGSGPLVLWTYEQGAKGCPKS